MSATKLELRKELEEKIQGLQASHLGAVRQDTENERERISNTGMKPHLDAISNGIESLNELLAKFPAPEPEEEPEQTAQNTPQDVLDSEARFQEGDGIPKTAATSEPLVGSASQPVNTDYTPLPPALDSGTASLLEAAPESELPPSSDDKPVDSKKKKG